MKCPKCQFENPDEMQFCVECGNKLEISCSECGFGNSPAFKFCGKCGHDLKKPAEIPPIDFNQPQSYTPKFLADKILTTRSSIEGERKLVTVLFADVANYTSLSEKLDPEEVHQIMDGCFQILMNEIHRYEGTINQFTGDGVMALFGAPVAHEDHAQRACHAALSIQKTMAEYGEKIQKECGIEFKMRVGLNSGPVIVGSIGDDLRMDYTAVGDTTNLAARMQTMAKSGTILVSKNAHKISRDFFEFESLGEVQVKGKEELQEAYKLTKPSEVETRIEAAAIRGLTKFVGRQKQIQDLKEAFEEARSGSGQVVGIVGEAGVGKSRLLIELRSMLPEGEYTYLEGRCLHFGGSMAYLPILDVLRSYFAIKEGDREFIIKKKMKEGILQLDKSLEAVLPFYHDLLSLKVEDEEYLKLVPQQKREKTFEAIRDLLIRESENKPLVLTIEDLHWIDKTSEEFLDYLIGWIANTNILLLLLYRPEYTHQWGSKSYYSRIGVDQLSTKSSAQLVQSILEGGEVVADLRELILNRAAGNPLFMEEFTHTLLENGSIEKRDNQYVLSEQASDVEVPDTIQGIIAARMDRLEDDLKRTMQVASVIGRDFAFRILHSITGMREELKSYLLNLQGLEFIYEKRLFPELEYIFKHALIQEVAYNSLLLKRRKEIHEQIGKAIEELYAERLEEFYEMLAYHYSRTDDLDKAYRYMKLSAEKAAKNFSNWEAFGFFKEAIELLKKRPSTEENKNEQLRVILSMGTSFSLLGYPEDSLDFLQEGERLATELGDEASLTRLLAEIGVCYGFKGDPRFLQYTERAFEAANKAQDVGLLASTAMELCTAYHTLGEYEKVLDVAPSVVDLFEKTNTKQNFFGKFFNPYSALCMYCGYSHAMLGNFGEGEALLEKALRFAVEINHLPTMGCVETFYGVMFLYKGDGKNAVKHYEKAIRYFEESQTVMILGLTWCGLGYGYYLSGRPKEAGDLIEKGIKMQLDIGPVLVSFNYWQLGMIHFDSGDLENAQTCAEKALEFSRQLDEKHNKGLSWELLGRTLGKADPKQIDKAKEYILKGIRIHEEWKLKPLYSLGYFFLGELHADTGQRENALENLKKAEGMFIEMGLDYWLNKTQEILGRLEN